MSFCNTSSLSLSLSDTSPDITPVPVANGVAVTEEGHPAGKPGLIPIGMPSAVVPCREATQRALVNEGLRVPNGHVPPVQDSPFIGYIIAMHRKMVGTTEYIDIVFVCSFGTQHQESVLLGLSELCIVLLDSDEKITPTAKSPATQKKLTRFLSPKCTCTNL